MSNFEFITSNKGKNLIKCNNYLYRQRSKTGNVSYWSCVETNCKSRGKLSDSSFSLSSDHNHQQNFIDLIQRNQRSKVKEIISTDPTISGLTVYNQATNQLINRSDIETQSELIGASLQPFISLQPTISYNKLKLLPPLPVTRSGIVIPENFKQSAGKDFLLAEDGDEDKILIFGTRDFFRILCASKNVYMDGTFKCVPSIFYQLYTIHVMVKDLMIPVIYALLPDKNRSTYIRFFRMIQDLAIDAFLSFSPEVFILDFELGVISAIKNLFSSSTIKCCNFHFGQCVWRKVQNIGLKKDYGVDQNVTKTIKRLISLPLIKPVDIDEVFEKIVIDAGDGDKIEKLLEYFYDNFYKTDARFERSLWNTADLIGPRTTNHLEGWHHAINLDIKISHPNLWIFIKKIMNQQKIFETRLLIQNSGTNVVRKRNKWIQINIKRDKLFERYNNGELSALEYLDRIKYLQFV
ncbi:uncharacterized protein LOC128397669 [Panonychus citri]|uniref:uncharacterized protein LOC128397669 n=1 Tax=Panonychus citri TaxID=50023 RepID=UPI002306E425|nr:uncharacterized protein LOC128397669 [Panonychus citri]